MSVPRSTKLIKDLCAFTGKTWDEARFKEVMTISQRNSYLWERANNLLDTTRPHRRIRAVQLYVRHGVQPG